jgi:hypothetical protein
MKISHKKAKGLRLRLNWVSTKLLREWWRYAALCGKKVNAFVHREPRLCEMNRSVFINRWSSISVGTQRQAFVDLNLFFFFLQITKSKEIRILQPASSLRFKKAWSYTFTSQYVMMWCLIKQRIRLHGMVLTLRTVTTLPLILSYLYLTINGGLTKVEHSR